MPIADKVKKFSVWISQNNYFNYYRTISLSLESGGKAYIAFPKERPANWLQFVGSDTNLFMTQDEFAEVYHLIQSERPVFFTALNIEGIEVGAVHTELDLSHGENPGESGHNPHSMESLIRRLRTGIPPPD